MSLKLKRFVNSLERNDVFNFNHNSFDSRLRLQKYLYIASFFGINLDYHYGLYIHGPYSNSLAKHYYSLDSVKTRRGMSLDRGYLELIRGKSSRWLELAATLLLFKKREPSSPHSELVKSVKKVKPKAPVHFIEEIAKELEDINIL